MTKKEDKTGQELGERRGRQLWAGQREAMAFQAEESGGTGGRRTAARDSVSGGWPTVPVIGPHGCVSLRPLLGLESPLGRKLPVRPQRQFLAERPGQFLRG